MDSLLNLNEEYLKREESSDGFVVSIKSDDKNLLEIKKIFFGGRSIKGLGELESLDAKFTFDKNGLPISYTSDAKFVGSDKKRRMLWGREVLKNWMKILK